MRTPRSHYETAFERYLDLQGMPHVAVDELRQMVRRDTGLKSFDYVVYPPAGPPCLVDVKGRKSVGESRTSELRQKNWVTQSDVDGLLAWQGVFGPGYLAMFVFAYWLADAGGGGEPPSRDSFSFAGRWYSFWLVSVAEYRAHQRKLSDRWRTVSVPRAAFREISRPLAQCWFAASC